MKLFTSDWDLNLYAGTPAQPKPRVGPKPTWPGLEPSPNPWCWFQDLMELRFLMSHHRKNLVRDKVIGKTWIFSDSGRSTRHRERAISEGESGESVSHHRVQSPVALKRGVVSFYGLGNLIC